MTKKVIAKISFVLFITAIVLLGCASKNSEPLPATIYLSELEWESATLGEGEAPQKDLSITGETIKLTNNTGRAVEFEKGIGTHADSEIVYDISEMDYNYFTTWVGVERDAGSRHVSLQFEIYVDDELKYQSNRMGFRNPVEFAKVEITGGEKLKLVVDGGENEDGNNYGTWADAQLHKEDPVVSNVEDVKEYDGMVLIFNENFDSDEIDQEKWSLRNHPENGTHHYANVVGDGENIWVKDGNLHIQAKEYEGNGNYSTTSAAISTENKFYFRYGRVDVRAKLPTEDGMWPAIWMMPEKPDYGWPLAGEIDIMELVSDSKNKIWSTIHSGIYQTNHYFNSGGTLTIDQGTFYDDYHVFSLEWEPDRMTFYVDDEVVADIHDWKNWIKDTKTDEVIEREFPAPFNRNFYLILNVATGGWSKDVNETTRFGERTTMKVDYVRVYQKDHSVSSAADLREIVDYYASAGDFSDESVVKTLHDLIVSIEEYEEDGKEEEMIDLLKALKVVLDHQRENGEIVFDDAYHALVDGVEALIAE